VPSFFHVDRSGQCQAGHVFGLQPAQGLWDEHQQHIQALFPNGITSHGLNWLINPGMDGFITLRELTFEFVRRAGFPDCPSRYQSIFAFETRDDAHAFINIYCGGDAVSILKVDAEESFRANMQLLDVKSKGVGISDAAHDYWRGDRGQAGELWEHLLVPPVTVIGKV
jgi:hypothetical protein